MSSISVLIPIGSMTLTDQKEYRLKALSAGFARSHKSGVGKILPEEISGFDSLGTQAKINAVYQKLLTGWVPHEIDVHELQNLAADVTAAPAVNDWLTAALAVVGTAYSCFQAVNPTVPANKLHVYWKVSVETVPPPVNWLTFRTQGAVGNVVGLFDLSMLYTRQDTEGYFSEPIVYDPTTPYAVQATARIATGLAARVILGAYVFEPANTTVTR